MASEISKREAFFNQFKKNNFLQANLNGSIKKTTTIAHTFKEVEKTNSGHPMSSYEPKKTLHFFDKQNCLSKIEQYDEDNISIGKRFYTYDGDNNIKKIYYNHEPPIVYRYVQINNGDTLLEIFNTVLEKAKYDFHKNQIRIYRFYNKNDGLSEKTILRLFENTNQVESLTLTGMSFDKTITQKDSLGNIISIISSDGDDLVYKEKYYDYTFDKHQNWIKKTEFIIEQKTKKTKTFFKRIIEYYY